MAAEQVPAEQDDVDRHDQGSGSEAERLASRCRVGKPQCLPYIESEDEKHADREEQHVAMNVLEDERKRVLAPVRGPRLANGAGRGIGPERLVVRTAVVVARQPEEPRDRQDEQRGRERKPGWPRAGPRAEP